jgi:hypothetical protein
VTGAPAGPDPLATPADPGYDRPMRMGRVAGLAAVVTLVAACAMDQNRPFFHDEDKDTPEFSAARLGDPMDEDSVADFLRPDERNAVRRSGMTGIRVDEPKAELDEPAKPPQGAVAHALDTTGKVGVSLLGVGLTIGAAVAPFLLF